MPYSNLSQPGWGYRLCQPDYYLPPHHLHEFSDLATALSWIHQQCYSRTFYIDIQYCKFLHFAKQKLVWIIVKLQHEVVKTWIFVFTVLLAEKPAEKKDSLFLFSIEFELGKFFCNASYRYVINVLESHLEAHLISCTYIILSSEQSFLEPIQFNLNNFTQFLLTTCTDLYRLLQSQQKVVCAHLNWTGFPVYT